MKKIFILPLLAISVVFSGCNNEKNTKQAEDTTNQNQIDMNNPFLKESELELQAPDFTKIKDSDFLPALEEGIRLQLEEIESIANNSEEPTFENTLVELEKSGRMLARVQGVFYLLAGANTNETIQEVQEIVAPKFAGLSDAIYLNENLYKRVQTIFEQRENLDLDAESLRLLEYYHKNFVLAGANLSSGDKEKLKEINSELASLTTKFSNQILAASKENAFVTDNLEDLEGLSESALATAAKDAGEDGKWEIPMLNTTQQPIFTNLKNQNTRKQIFENAWSRAEKGGENDTRKTLIKIVELRALKAKLIGFDSYAAWNLQSQMAENPENVADFFAQLVPAATKKVKKEEQELLELIKKDNPEATTVNAWDWNYYSEQLRKIKYDLDEDAIKPYFVLDSVLQNGVFYSANRLYGLSFKERFDLPVYQEDVRVFDVFEEDGSKLGIFYADYFKRDNKRGGAWMSNIVKQSHLFGTKPVIYNVCNYTKPAEGQPALLSWDNVITLFHEFGHALHGFFANQKYVSISGTSTPRDFVELPSQFNEHWALEPEVFENYAIHYETGESMPKDLVEKIKKSSTFNQGYKLTELLAAANLDMQWHSIGTDVKIEDATKFEREALERTNLLLEAVPPRYRSTYFSHIFAGGYASGYYAYLWTEMLDNDAYVWFEQNGGMTRKNGQRFRDMILSVGNSVDLAKAYQDFVGHEPDIRPMLKNRGMNN